MNTLIKSTMILMIALVAVAGKAIKSDTDWLKQKHAQLVAITNATNMANIGLCTSGDKQPNGRYSYFPNGNGLIRFEDKTWIIIVSHSMHAEDGLGDVTIIRTSDGRYLVNKGHVCDKLILDAPEKITSLNSFLKATGKGPKGEATTWEPYQGEPTDAASASRGP